MIQNNNKKGRFQNESLFCTRTYTHNRLLICLLAYTLSACSLLTFVETVIPTPQAQRDSNVYCGRQGCRAGGPALRLGGDGWKHRRLQPWRHDQRGSPVRSRRPGHPPGATAATVADRARGQLDCRLPLGRRTLPWVVEHTCTEYTYTYIYINVHIRTCTRI